MSRFKFFLIGTNEAPVLELPVVDLHELHQKMQRSRFVEGRMVEINGEFNSRDVLIPINRIQMVAEAD